jgi:hypothetical protein
MAAWKVFRYRDTAHALAGVRLRSRRNIDLPGYPEGRGPSGLTIEETHDVLWRQIDGWHVFTADHLAEYARLRDLSDRERLLYGLDDDTVALVEVPGLLDGELSPALIAVPAALLEDLPEITPEELAAWEEKSGAERQRRECLHEEFRRAYYRGSVPTFTDAEYASAISTTDFNHVTGILVDQTPGVLWDVKCNGHACHSHVLRGALVDPSRGDVSWDYEASIAARWMLTDWVCHNAALGGGLHGDLFNAVLPQGWSVAERFADIAVEAFVPVKGPSGEIGLLVWPNSD